MTNVRTIKSGLVLPTLFLMLSSALFLMLPEAWAGKYYWISNYGGTGQEQGWSIQNTTDGGYVVAGLTVFFGADDDFWVLRLNGTGNIPGCSLIKTSSVNAVNTEVAGVASQAITVLNTSGLPVGTYTFYFGVDMNMNASLDFNQLYYDGVVVDVTQ